MSTVTFGLFLFLSSLNYAYFFLQVSFLAVMLCNLFCQLGQLFWVKISIVNFSFQKKFLKLVDCFKTESNHLVAPIFVEEIKA